MASRYGAIRASAMAARTVLLVVRFHYHLVMLEFQSSTDPYTAVRILSRIS